MRIPSAFLRSLFPSLFTLCLLAGRPALVLAADARVVSVNFGASLAMDPNETAGLVAASHWNNALGGAGCLRPLRDASDRDLPIALFWTGGSGAHAAKNVEGTSGNSRMMKEYLDSGPDTTTTVTVSGLGDLFKNDGYDVIVYFKGSPEGKFRIAEFTLAGKTVTAADMRDRRFDGTFKEAAAVSGTDPIEGNYVRFRGLKGDSFLLTIKPGKADDPWPRAPINGLQIVPSNARP